MAEELTAGGLQKNDSTVSDEFHWKRSDNSFAFNFVSESTPSLPQKDVAPAEAQPRQDKKSDTASGFTFNFQIPVETPQNSESRTMEAEKAEYILKSSGTEAQTSELTAHSSKSKAKKKKKKKDEGGGGAGQQKSTNKIMEEAPKHQSTALTPEQQLNRELDWCIEQLELGLRTQKSSTRQKEEASRALKTLRSSKAPVVKKRQVMRAVSGDYRKKMEEERERQFRLIQSAITSARVTTVPEPSCKSVFHRCAETKRSTIQDANIPENGSGLSNNSVQTLTAAEQFVFRPSQEEFRFNFDL